MSAPPGKARCAIREVAAGLLLLEQHLHAEDVAVERDRTLEIEDGEAGVVERRHQNVIVTPPSTVITWPVRYVLRSEQSHAAWAAISVGSAGRRSGSFRCSR
jgi:hypothetical protein